MRKLFLLPALLAMVATAFVVAPGTQAVLTQDAHAVEAHSHSTEAHATSVEDIEGAPANSLVSAPTAWPVPSVRSYRILSSCSQYASAIRRGAAAWQGMTESANGTPVECRNSYISDCGAGGRIVGCNWGQGQRIALYMGGVSDDALLAAHEFGHDWYGHSSYQCAGWSSPQEVMAPTMCNYSKAAK